MSPESVAGIISFYSIVISVYWLLPMMKQMMMVGDCQLSDKKIIMYVRAALLIYLGVVLIASSFGAGLKDYISLLVVTVIPGIIFLFINQLLLPLEEKRI